MMKAIAHISSGNRYLVLSLAFFYSAVLAIASWGYRYVPFSTYALPVIAVLLVPALAAVWFYKAPADNSPSHRAIRLTGRVLIVMWAYVFFRMSFSPFAPWPVLFITAWLAGCILSFISSRFIFLLIPLSLYSLHLESSPLLHIAFDHTNYHYLTNATLLLVAYHGYYIIVPWLKGLKASARVQEYNARCFVLLLGGMIGMGYFLALYFKALAYNSPFAWITENNFAYTVGYFLNTGGTHLSWLPFSKNGLYLFLHNNHVAIQALIWFSELSFLFILLSRRLFYFNLVFITLFHLTFLVVSGYFFWKWMVVNFLFALLIKYVPIYDTRFRYRLLLTLGMVLLGNYLFLLPRLGWKDPQEPEHFQWVAALPAGKISTPLPPLSFSTDSLAYIPVDPAVFFPFEKNMVQAWKFRAIHKRKEAAEDASAFLKTYQDGDNYTSLYSGHVPAYNHFWTEKLFYRKLDPQLLEQVRYIALTRQVFHIPDSTYHMQPVSEPEILYLFPFNKTPQQ